MLGQFNKILHKLLYGRPQIFLNIHRKPIHTWFALFYLTTEMKTIKKILCVKLVTKSPYPVVWCLRPSGKNLGILRSQIIISAVPKCGVILQNLESKKHMAYIMTQNTICNIC